MAKKHDCPSCDHDEERTGHRGPNKQGGMKREMEGGEKKHKSKDVHGKILNMAKEK